jgi:hypothetical protein
MATVTGSTIRNNTGTNDGGGINNTGMLTVQNSVIAGNVTTATTTTVNGGGLFNLGTLAITSSIISRNSATATGATATANGGGIGNAGTATITNSTISNNSATATGGGTANGGGIYSFAGTFNLTASTVSGNTTSGNGGGIDNTLASTLNVTNSTLSANMATGNGGGVFTDATQSILNSTVSNNTAASGGGLFIDPAATSTVKNTIVAGDTAAPGLDLFGSLGSTGHNLIGNDSGGSGFDPSDQRNVNPLLGPLQDNGGPTLTQALLPTSPAIGGGDPIGAPANDQRGFARKPTPDIGAFDVQSTGVLAVTAPDPRTVVPGRPFNITVTARDPNGNVLTGYTETVTLTSSDPSAVLPGSPHPFTLADAGMFTFTGVVLSSVGNQTITATGATLRGQGAFNVEVKNQFITAPASDNATVQPDGPRAGPNGKAFFNIEGRPNDTFASFGVLEFNTATFHTGPVDTVASLTVNLTPSNASFTSRGLLRFFVTMDNTTSIQPDMPPALKFDPTDVNGLDGQLQPRFDLGTGQFVPVRNGVVDSFSFAITHGSPVETYLIGQLNNPLGKIRVIVAPELDPVDGELVAATYAGATFNPSAFRPRLLLDAGNQGLGGGGSGGGGSGGGFSFLPPSDSGFDVALLPSLSSSISLPTRSTGTLVLALDAPPVEHFFTTDTNEAVTLPREWLRPSSLRALDTSLATLLDHFFTLGKGNDREHTVFSGE